MDGGSSCRGITAAIRAPSITTAWSLADAGAVEDGVGGDGVRRGGPLIGCG